MCFCVVFLQEEFEKLSHQKLNLQFFGIMNEKGNTNKNQKYIYQGTGEFIADKSCYEKRNHKLFAGIDTREVYCSKNYLFLFVFLQISHLLTQKTQNYNKKKTREIQVEFYTHSAKIKHSLLLGCLEDAVIIKYHGRIT